MENVPHVSFVIERDVDYDIRLKAQIDLIIDQWRDRRHANIIDLDKYRIKMNAS